MIDFQTIIVNDCFYKEKILGLTFVEWQTKNLTNVTIVNSEDEIELDIINSENLLILHSSYPLIKIEDINYIVDYSTNKKLTICNFNGGFFVKKGYFLTKNAENIVSSELNFDYNFKILDNLSLYNAKEILRLRIIEKHIKNGVLFHNINSVIIDETVKIGNGVIIGNNCEIYGKNEIGANCEITLNSYLKDATLKDNVKVISSYLEDCEINEKSIIGPMAHIRPTTKVGKNCKIGNYVEIKNSTIDDNTKISHLTYVGDAKIGKNCNLGCGVVFCNYDGKNKHKTSVGNNCFIGSNVNLVAPLKIEDNCFIACGSTVTKDLNEKTFAIERGELKQKVNKFQFS